MELCTINGVLHSGMQVARAEALSSSQIWTEEAVSSGDIIGPAHLS